MTGSSATSYRKKLGQKYPYENRIGIIGHSQGGWISQLASVLYPEDVAFIVNLAGPSTSVIEQVLDDYKGEYIAAGLSESEINQKLKRHKAILDFAYAVAPVLKFGSISHIIRYDAEYVSRRSIRSPG